MLKTILILPVFGLLSLFGLLQNQVTLMQNTPSSAKAGDEFLIEITITKGDIEGFARYQMDVPVGFTAVARQTANGDFSFQDQKVKIQWMRVPFDREFKISYALQVAPTISGDFTFEGKFSYIQNNSVQTASTGVSNINIAGDEVAAGIAAAAQTTYTYQNVSLKNIDCIRQKPFLNDKNEVIVNLLINKGDLREFGKIQEQIPRGYNAVSLKSKNSIFTYKNGIIKFLWMNMPPEQQFTVSYKLIPEAEVPDQAFIISGTFSYAENERTKTINIAERNVDISTFTGDEVLAQNTPEPEPEITAPIETVTTPEPTPVIEPTPEPVQQPVAEATPVTPAETYTQPATTTYQNTNTNTSYTNTPTTYDNMPMVAEGVRYRVQIAAGHKLVNQNYFKKLNITDPVQTEIHDGWHKYTIGNFMIYKDARDYRIYVWNNTPIHDAFVAAYNNGIRITVQEALMIANQNWYN